MKRVTINSLPDDEIDITCCSDTKLYGFIGQQGDKYKLFQGIPNVGWWISMTNTDEFCNGNSTFKDSLKYMIRKGFAVIQFDNIQEFGRWLAE